jgi:hypothetical protein
MRRLMRRLLVELVFAAWIAFLAAGLIVVCLALSHGGKMPRVSNHGAPECVAEMWCDPDNPDGAAPGYYDEFGHLCPDPSRPCVLDSIGGQR